MSTREQQRAFRLEQDLRLLVPIARRKASRAKALGGPGITVENIQEAVRSQGLMLAYTDRGYLSRLYGQVMIRAELEVVKGKSVRTKRRGTKGGNRVSIWRRAA